LTRQQLDRILQPEVLTQPHAFGTAPAASAPQVAEKQALSMRRDQTD
jgi:hypothetical protein